MNLSTLMVYIHDMPKAVAFYRDVLGLSLTMESPYWSQFDLNGITLGLHPAPEGATKSAPGWIPGFHVADVQAMKAKVTSGSLGSIAQDYHDIPGGGKHLRVPSIGPRVPPKALRPAVDQHQHRILLRRHEVRRAHQKALHFRVLRAVDPELLDRL